MAITAQRPFFQQPKQEKLKASTLLSYPNVIIKNPSQVLAKLLNILYDGKDKLHIITGI
ncbi:hypothetical protein DSO57_1012113 [Entomophthora muscae]|uniref:Uncharacterized protein n=1 Tax=Entomophthora muscae TaxID=34485 RepID=A0ACC2SJ52_9FUNG|nr:hypothetical protein DSO57_1012113 [Entomophthora muscae]